MMRVWMGVALLAVSWLLGSDYYYPANNIAWLAVLATGTALLSGSIRRMPPRREIGIALVLLVPAVWFAPWPLRAAGLLIAAGLAIELLPIPRRWVKLFGRGAVAAAAVMLAQSLAMAFYAAQTARSHELPWPLPDMLAGIARLLAVDAAAAGSTVVMHSIRQVHRLGATWELLIDPPTVCFFVGSLVMFGLMASARLSGRYMWLAWLRALGTLTLVLAAWLPIRAGLMMGLYLHRVSRADPHLPLHVMNLFLSPWVLLLMLLGPVLLTWRFVRLPDDNEHDDNEHDDNEHDDNEHDDNEHETTEEPGRLIPSESKRWHYPASIGLVLLAVAVFTAGVEWDPVGTRKAGRVMVVERHSTWEPTTRPYDTKWFGHDSGYNYAAIYRYCSQYFQMSRLLQSDRIDAENLRRCDVLVIKTPTQRYSGKEVDAVVRFVKRGGSLLLIGDHTNVFKSGTYMNDITRKMGFTFRDDLLFGTGDSPYDQSYRIPRMPHPVVQHLPTTDFAVSCSIDPGRSQGRAVIRNTGLWSLPPDYHLSNYHTVPQLRPDMRYGAFIQLWSTRFGKGRVLAFTDSTIFSNFCIFQPGKAELFVGMIEWLNHNNRFGDPRWWLLGLGSILLVVGLWLARTRRDAWLVPMAAGVCGWAVSSAAIAMIGRAAMPVPQVKKTLTRVVIDRTTSDVPLSQGAYIQGEGEGFGLFEQWISRSATPTEVLYTTRRTGAEAFSGDVLVVICPNCSVDRPYRERLVEYVKQGGKLLVLDSPENTASTANSLLWPFGLSVIHDPNRQTEADQSQVLTISGEWPGIAAGPACEITGGEPIAKLGETPVGAVTRCEKGLVMAVGFGSLLNDAGMGYAWNSQATAEMLFTSDTYVRYNVQFSLFRALLTGQPVAAFYSGSVVVDRTASEVTLPDADAIPEADDGFGLAEMWISSLGYHRTRGSGNEVFSGDVLVIFLPSAEVPDVFRQHLDQYIAEGGKLLLVDSPQNESSTANDLLESFKLSVDHDAVQQGRLVVDKHEANRAWPNTPIDPACRVSGGEAFAWLDQTPVGATARHGKGAVTVVGCGSMLTNAGLRNSWDLPPPAKSLVPYDLLTAILRALMTDQPVAKSVPSVAD